MSALFGLAGDNKLLPHTTAGLHFVADATLMMTACCSTRLSKGTKGSGQGSALRPERPPRATSANLNRHLCPASQARIAGTDDRFCPIGDLQFVGNVRDKVPHRLYSEREGLGDSRVGLALRNQRAPRARDWLVRGRVGGPQSAGAVRRSPSPVGRRLG